MKRVQNVLSTSVRKAGHSDSEPFWQVMDELLTGHAPDPSCFLKVYFSKRISQNEFLKMFFSSSQNMLSCKQTYGRLSVPHSLFANFKAKPKNWTSGRKSASGER